MDNIGKFELMHPVLWRKKALAWGNKHQFCAYTNPNLQNFPHDPFLEILAVGAKEIFKSSNDPFSELELFHQQTPDWLFGYFGYELKNFIEDRLSSRHPPRAGFEDISFFKPLHLIRFNGDEVEIKTEGSPEKIFKEIEETRINSSPMPRISFKTSTSKEEYLKKASNIRTHIIEGDIYELNLCIEFFAENVLLDPLEAYHQLVALSPTPFSGFLRINENYLISASPERFIRKTGNKLLSQPIKGTAKRSQDNIEDKKLKEGLQNNEKERAENMMIVDLVRNDLSKSSNSGSVKVEEMFGIYSFRQWHQMISTVSSEARENISPVEIIKNAFPMGSMTGAPKIKVMELIDRYENSRRGVYSGAFGYITPDGDFDLNVVIRSLIYNASQNLLTFHVGSALTYDSIPEQEYEECMLKASAIFQLFRSNENSNNSFIST